MSNPGSNESRRKGRGDRNSSSGTALWWIVALAVVACVGFWLKPRPKTADPIVQSGNSSTNPPGATSTESSATTAPAVPPERLVGGWVRPDGGYLLEIRAVHADGRAEAAYFNPRSINVAKAEWKRESGQLRLFVELRDLNYPGSTYRLALSPDGQQLVGIYHQAVQGQDFEVQFVREK